MSENRDMNYCLQYLSTSDFTTSLLSLHTRPRTCTHTHAPLSGKTLIIFNKKRKATHMYFRDKYIYIKREWNSKFFSTKEGYQAISYNMKRCRQ